MSTRPQAGPFAAISNASMSADIVSAITIIRDISVASYSYAWTGSSPVGTISVQVSNDVTFFPDGSINNAGNWVSLPLVVDGSTITAVPISGNSGNGILDIPITGVYAIRTIYTRTSGSGTLNAVINCKVT